MKHRVKNVSFCKEPLLNKKCDDVIFTFSRSSQKCACSPTQVLFFGFGWLFFMRQLFKDYEVLQKFINDNEDGCVD